jgi:hypothetical protein
MNELLDLIPQIKRAREYRLYDYKGNRFLDFYQNNGHSILGHRPGTLTKQIKNTISRGLIYDIPSVYQKRLKKELAKTFKDYKSFHIFNSLEHALKNAYEYLNTDPLLIGDPAFNNIEKISFYRPFLTEKIEKQLFSKSDILIPILPFSLGGSPVITCIKKNIDNIQDDHISPFILSGTLNSIYNLRKAVLHNYRFSIKSKYWTCIGIYLVPNMKKEKYKKAFKYFLNNGILISPYYNKPSILPGTATPGEIKKVIGIFNNITDNI